MNRRDVINKIKEIRKEEQKLWDKFTRNVEVKLWVEPASDRHMYGYFNFFTADLRKSSWEVKNMSLTSNKQHPYFTITVYDLAKIFERNK